MDNITHSTKPLLLEKAFSIIGQQISDLEAQLDGLQQSSASESKSSSGDKYETARETINQTRGMLEKQLTGFKFMNAQIKAVPLKAMDSIQEGALIELEMGWLWVSVAMGKVVVDGIDFHLVSKNSPLVEILWGSSLGNPSTLEVRMSLSGK